jgi:arginase
MDLPVEAQTPLREPPRCVALLGIPWDESSSHLRGAAAAPACIREFLASGSMNLCAEDSTDLGAEPRFYDLGDLALSPGPAARDQIEAAVARCLGRDLHLLALGGDHALTYPAVRAYARTYPGLTILHLDAHPDLYDQYEGNRYSHACPFARILEEGLVCRLVQVGIRAMNPHQRAQAERFGVEVHEMRHWQGDLRLELEGPVYLSLDMDVLDPGFAPGVSHPEPGGLSSREVIRLVRRLRAPVVGADLVEFNPSRDLMGITAACAAKLVKEIAVCLLRSSSGGLQQPAGERSQYPSKSD